MKTIVDLILLSANYLKEKNILNPRRIAEELIADALNLNRLDLYLKHDRPLVEEELEKVRVSLRRCSMGEPVPYIRGHVEFYGCTIKVGPSVLIPRHETEILVDLTVKELETTSLAGKTLLDLCTGSGCIGLGIKKRFPELAVTLADSCDQALQVAIENAAFNQLEVTIAKGDFLMAVEGRLFDYIICNPPYISTQAYATLEKSVKDFEPQKALLAGKLGLEFYERLAKEGFNYLKPQGKAFLEIGYDQGEALLKLFVSPPFKNCKLNKDWAGHDRFFSLEIE